MYYHTILGTHGIIGAAVTTDDTVNLSASDTPYTLEIGEQCLFSHLLKVKLCRYRDRSIYLYSGYTGTE